MATIQFAECEMKEVKFAQMNAGFVIHTLEPDNPVQTSERYTFVALAGDNFIGCASSLTYKNSPVYNGWFYLTDLFIESGYRGQGLGASILQTLKDRVTALGITHFWTFTADYEAPGFYQKQGYRIVFAQENWYFTDYSWVAFHKGADAKVRPMKKYTTCV